jgi:protocatechuate 3,4-dioxygenase beta subunit
MKSFWRLGGVGARVVLAIFVALMKPGFAQNPPAPAPSGIDPAMEKPLEDFIAKETAREASIHFLHFVLERRETYIHADGSVLKPPMPTHLEAWIDTVGNVYRYEYKPRVSQWIDGPAPYSAEDSTQLCDGKMQYYITRDEDLANLQGRPVQPNVKEYREDLLMHDPDALQTAQYALGVLLKGKPAGFAPDMRVQWTTWNGIKVLEVVEDYPNFQGPPGVSQRRVYRLDPAHDLALVSYEMSIPTRDKGGEPFLSYAVDRFAKSSAGFFYPAVYRTGLMESGTGKYDSTSEQSVAMVSTYEPLSALPAHLTDLPKPQGDEYVAQDGTVAQPPAIHLTVLDGKTKKPVANAPVVVRIDRQKEVLTKTDANGAVDIPLPKEEVKYLSLACDQAPYVPQVAQWRRYANPLRIPAQYEMDLAAGLPISGRIEDESGQPVAGAEVEAAIFEPRSSSPSFSNQYDLWFHKAKSDAQGKWRLERFPESLDGLSMRVSHPDFAASTDYGSEPWTMLTTQPVTSLRDGTAVIVLKRGNTLTGQILGADGKPAAGARLTVGKDMWGSNLPQTKTDATGHFTFKGLASGDNTLTIEAAGCKPKAIAISPPQTQALGTIQMEKGRVLRGHVVDAVGKPLAGCEVVADTWNQLRTVDDRLVTDANGNFTWDGAPDEPVIFVLLHGASGQTLYDLSLTAGDAVQTITMKPAMHLKAQVVDAKTGQPIAKFRVTPGLLWPNSPDPTWEGERAKFEQNGAFEWKSNRIGPGCVLKIEAEGYATLISDPYATTQGDYTAVFKLTK